MRRLRASVAVGMDICQNRRTVATAVSAPTVATRVVTSAAPRAPNFGISQILPAMLASTSGALISTVQRGLPAAVKIAVATDMATMPTEPTISTASGVAAGRKVSPQIQTAISSAAQLVNAANGSIHMTARKA